jgi:hypothetical protein
MTTLELQRTLVKSPPELWSELSDRDRLARVLDEGFGDLRIVRATPERLVHWSASGASGLIELEPAGWGTRVKLTAELAAAVAPGPARAALERLLDDAGAAHRRPFSR